MAAPADPAETRRKKLARAVVVAAAAALADRPIGGYSIGIDEHTDHMGFHERRHTRRYTEIGSCLTRKKSSGNNFLSAALRFEKWE